MKKIAIVQKIEYYVPTVSTIRAAEQLPNYRFLHVKDFEIGVLDNNSEIKSINTKTFLYNNFIQYKLGDLVIYDDENNKVLEKKYITDNFSENEKNDIIQFLKQYKKEYEEATKTSNNDKKEQLSSILRSLISYLEHIKFTEKSNNIGFKK